MSTTRKMHSFRLPESTTQQIKELMDATQIASQADVITEAVRILHVERVKFRTWRQDNPKVAKMVDEMCGPDDHPLRYPVTPGVK